MKPPRIVSRSEWGARYSNGSGPAPVPAAGGVVVHHSTDPERNGAEAIRRLEGVGQTRFGAGISYTFPITADGTIYEGHGVDRKGTHTGGHNSTVRAFCFHGNYMEHPPTPAQQESAAQLLAYGKVQGWWPSTRLRGHRDFKATACPGDMAYPLLGSISARADQILAGAPPAPTPAPTLEVNDMAVAYRFPDGNVWLCTGTHREHVNGRELQERAVLRLVAEVPKTDPDRDDKYPQWCRKTNAKGAAILAALKVV